MLELIDGGIVDVQSDNNYISGCDTCDYGSRYINYFDIELTKTKIKIEATQTWDYPLSEGLMMKILLSNVDDIKNMTENEFAQWLKTQLKNEIGDLEYNIYSKL
jgi:hypothetical protein